MDVHTVVIDVKSLLALEGVFDGLDAGQLNPLPNLRLNVSSNTNVDTTIITHHHGVFGVVFGEADGSPALITLKVQANFVSATHSKAP